MKKSSLFILLLSFLILPLSSQVEHLEPPFWWAGMKNPDLQLMVHGKDIGSASVELKYEGAILISTTRVDNPNYLFLDLELAQDIKPGKFDILFTRGNKKIGSYTYELKERETGSALREGFNNSDVMYLIMPDRFANGDPSNDEVKGMKEGLNRGHPYGRHGGDIKGIADHLDYISEMGFTAIWLNPVLENDQQRGAYHGYATTDFYMVDRRFGSNEDYRKLAEQSREKGVKMIMDMIFNHCGSEHWWMKDIPMADWINYYPEYIPTNHRRTTNQDPYASDYDSELMTRGWFVRTMPDLNLDNPFMANYMIQNSIWWIEYVHLAGIRMDTYPYPAKDAMAEWNRRVLEEYPDFNIVGEEWSLNSALVSYWQRGQTNNDGYDGEIPSMMDFPLQSALSESLLEDENWNAGWIKLYETLANDFLYPDPNNLVIFPDNHDMPRFYMQVGMDQDLYKMGITYILTTRGVPQIFYGSEILMTHTEGNDHGNIRKDFPGGWPGDEINGFTGDGLTKDEIKTQEYFRRLLKWRKKNPVIHTGKLLHFAPVDGIYVFFRHDENKKVMVVLNKNKNEQALKLDRFREILPNTGSGIDVLTGKEYNLSDDLIIPALSPLVLDIK